jgi:hypothetical protein
MRFLFLAPVVFLAACGGGGRTDMAPPTASIVFPPASLTEAGEIVVRGRAADDVHVAAIRVAGVVATTADGFRNWWATVPLAPGENRLTVEAEDGAGNVVPVAAEVTIVRTGALLAAPNGVALDAALGRALVVDATRGLLFSFDLATGAGTRITGAGPALPRRRARSRSIVV